MLNLTLAGVLFVLAAMPGAWGVNKDKDDRPDRNGRVVRFPNTRKRQLEKSDLSGVFDESKYLTYTVDPSKKNQVNSEDEEDVEELATKIELDPSVC